MIRDVCTFLASGAYFGFAPFIRGTFGTLPGVALFLALYDYPRLLFLLFFALLLVSFPLGTWAEKEWGEKDPQRFVLDEIVGFLLAVMFLPVGAVWKVSLAGFVLFRIFDGGKPPPIRNLQTLKGGAGIVVDDLAAGVCANVVLRTLIWMMPGVFA